MCYDEFFLTQYIQNLVITHIFCLVVYSLYVFYLKLYYNKINQKKNSKIILKCLYEVVKQEMKLLQ